MNQYERKRKSIRVTDECYKRALCKVHRPFLTKKQIKRDHLNGIRNRLINVVVMHNEKVSALYLKYILELPVNQLSTIVALHKEGVTVRHENTIAAIMTELFERAANSETRGKHES